MLTTPLYGTSLAWESPLNKGLVLALPMNEGVGDEVKDLSTNDNNGTLNNFASPPTIDSGWNRDEFGIWLNFDGINDCVDCGTNASLTIAGDMTAGAWIKPTGTINAYYYLGYDVTNGLYITATSAYCRVAGDGSIQANYSFVVDNWYYIVWTRTGDTYRCYVNGSLIYTDTGVTDAFLSRYVGSRGTTYSFKGSMFDVRIYNRALSPTEVMNYYMNPWQVYSNYYNISSRIKNRFTTPYHTEDGGNIDKLSQVFTWHIAELDNVTDDIVSAHQLSEATGHSLDQWGTLLQVTRDTGETDAHYRARLLSYSVLYRRSATPQQMVSSCADVLGVETSRIVLSDSASPATFSMTVFLSDIEDAGLSLPEYVDIMNVAKAGGVSLSLLSAGSFEYKAIAGGHDATKGYNNIADANPDGGVYAGLIGVV